MPLPTTNKQFEDLVKAFKEGKFRIRTDMFDEMRKELNRIDGDFHRYTVYHDETFHRYMDRMALIPELGHGDRNWRSWNFRRVRMYAKRWNFMSLYGVGGSISAPKPYTRPKEKDDGTSSV